MERAEQLRRMKECFDAPRVAPLPALMQPLTGGTGSKPRVEAINAREYLTRQPPPIEPIISGRIDQGDKVFIAGQSKSFKSFFALQMALCLVTGRSFLGWVASGLLKKVLIVQFELKPANYHRRVCFVAKACGISAEDIGDRLHIVNQRGKPFSLDSLRTEDYDVVFVDPFYKLLAHERADEVSAPDVSRVLGKIDELAERGPAVCLVHHGTKGRLGDKQTIDRLSGTGVLARDYDGCFTLTPHRDHPNEWFVLDTILRNYRSPDAVTVEFQNGLFVVRNDVPPETLTSKTAARIEQTGPSAEELTPLVARWITEPIRTGDLIDKIRDQFSIGEKKAAAIIRQLEREGFKRSKSGTFPSYAVISPSKSWPVDFPDRADQTGQPSLPGL